MRALFLRDPHNALCVLCGRPAKVVDHIRPHRGNLELYYDRTNWQALCLHCHAVKSAKERAKDGDRLEPHTST